VENQKLRKNGWNGEEFHRSQETNFT